nr:family 20 glycosylhydrolase [Clostridia bacterium]
VCPIRGYRVYRPGRENIDEFKKMIDMLIYYKYNSIILEIGGAMEYKNHPEINKSWVEFCNDVRRYSGRAHEIQHGTYPWPKNSIHCDNGDGSFLTQEECKDIAAYCRERSINVIPEEPTMSHSDYMLFGRPDLREQALDEYADTYCPSNPESYKLAFELLDEVIDVFNPEYINIGHDELYIVAVCPKCKGKDPAELYAQDIIKVHDHLASRGVKTMMWGEKLLDARFDNGAPCGGAESRRRDPVTGATTVYIPALWRCRSMLPRDILMLDWYWVFDYNNDKVYHENGYSMVYGNLTVASFKHWRLRLSWGAKGGFISNWGSNAEEYVQRNGQMLNLIYSSYAFWCPDYDDETDEIREYFGQRAIKEYYRFRHPVKRDEIIITHTTDHMIKFKSFYDGVFIEDEKYLLGNYEVTYEDGTTAYLPVKYGTNIVCRDVTRSITVAEYKEVCGATLPHVIGGKLYSECAYNNPYPEKNIMGIVYRPCEKFKDVNVYVRSIVYSPADEADDKTGGTLGGGFDSENMHNEKRNNE